MRIGRTDTYQNVLNIPAGQSGKFKIEHVTHPAGHLFQSSSWRTIILANHRSGQVAFSEPTRWHHLREGGSLWMTDYPIEQAQCDSAIRPFSGKVLVGGLGLGYAVTALAKRKAVTKIVVVERSADVIKLVWPHLDHGGKAEIVQDDLFHYLKKLRVAEKRNAFRWAFYDIWASDGEHTFHTMVAPLRKLSHGIVKHVRCWNEDVMRGQLKMGLQSTIVMLSTLKAKERDEQLAKLTSMQDPYHKWATPLFASLATRPQELKQPEKLKLWIWSAQEYVRRFANHCQ